jgi:hypothetical protein
MKESNLWYRAPVIVFAVLIGSLFVYVKSGGRFFSRAKAIPAAGQSPGDPGQSRGEFMMGPKSAPVYLPQEPVEIQQDSSAGKPASRPALFPGSKSAILLPPESLTPAIEPPVTPPAQPAPQQSGPSTSNSESIPTPDSQSLQQQRSRE